MSINRQDFYVKVKNNRQLTRQILVIDFEFYKLYMHFSFYFVSILLKT